MRYEYDTESWTLDIGTNPGYDAENQSVLSMDDFAALYLSCAEEVFRETGVYISSSAAESRSLYHGAWGCPKTGEKCFTLHGTRNPLFSEREPYEQALHRLIDLLKERLGQNAVYLETGRTHLCYFADEICSLPEEKAPHASAETDNLREPCIQRPAEKER